MDIISTNSLAPIKTTSGGSAEQENVPSGTHISLVLQRNREFRWESGPHNCLLHTNGYDGQNVVTGSNQWNLEFQAQTR